jgi:signal transduction histidine kinase
MFLIFSMLMGRQDIGLLIYLRLVILIFSFTSLIAFGVQVFRTEDINGRQDQYIGLGMMLLYAISLLAVGAIPWLNPAWERSADLMARYILAVPGAILAALALRKQGKQASGSKRESLSRSFKIASVGFVIYGITQLFGPNVDVLFANVINAKAFYDIFGFPIQATRAVLALLITFAVIRTTQIVGRERQAELLIAQKDRVAALEQVQEEMTIRNKMRKALLRRTVLLQEEERIRISRELHDETAQYLTAFSTNLAALKNRLPEEHQNEELLGRLHGLSDQMSLKLSRLVHDLRPAQLDELGLLSALAFLIERLETDLGLKVDFEVIGEYSRQEALIETVLFRVAQEALINVSRHAGTDHASVIIDQTKDALQISIIDEGKGFSVSGDQLPTDSYGLIGMRERVESVQGELEIISEVGQGTKMIAHIPLDSSTGEQDG